MRLASRSSTMAVLCWTMLGSVAMAQDSPALAPSAIPDAGPAGAPSAAPASPLPSWVNFSSTVVEYRLEPAATNPGIVQTFPKSIFNITHVDAFQYGTNFVSIDVLKSMSDIDPSAPVIPPGTGDPATDFYGIYRGTISGNAVTHSHIFDYGFIKDVSLEYGTNLEHYTGAIAPEMVALIAGPQVSFKVPGLLTISAHVWQEFNHNGLAQTFHYPNNPDYNASNGAVTYRPTASLEANYLFPLTFTHAPLTFNGSTVIVGPKGVDGFNHPTRTEFLSTNRLTLDAGSYFGHPKLVDVFVGYKYWHNKFGEIADKHSVYYLPGTVENQVFVGLDYHFN